MVTNKLQKYSISKDDAFNIQNGELAIYMNEDASLPEELHFGKEIKNLNVTSKIGDFIDLGFRIIFKGMDKTFKYVIRYKQKLVGTNIEIDDSEFFVRISEDFKYQGFKNLGGI